MIHVTLAERWEACWLSFRLRVEDEQEVWTASGRSPLEILPESFDLCSQVYAIRHATPSQVDEFPLALFGVSPDDTVPGMGIVWLLAAPQVKKAVAPILQAAPHFLNLMSQEFPLGLHNIVDARNTSHVEWCRAVGLTPGDTTLVNGYPFYYIHRPRPQEYFSCAIPSPLASARSR